MTPLPPSQDPRAARGPAEATPQPGPVEREMGLRAYVTRAPGIGGRLKSEPSDFQVDEVSRYPPPVPGGKYTIARVETHDVEQNSLLARLERALQLPPGTVGFAGTKDRRAITTQLLSLPVPVSRLESLTLSGVRVLESYEAAEPLHLGHLYGNRFRVVVGDLPLGPDEVEARLELIAGELRAAGGFPNYFGPQRFGEIRPVTHLVGRALVRESASAAVEAYLVAGVDGEGSEGQEARAAYAAHHDPARALREFPRNFTFERTLLEKLAQGKNGAQALRALPRNLRQLFVHAYQSYLFNLALSARLRAGIPLGEPIEGDRVLRIAPDGLESAAAPVPVSSDNLPEVRAWVASGRARVAGTLVGTETPLPAGVPGEQLRSILEAEGVAPKDFHLREAPDLSSRGTYRSWRAPLPLAFQGPLAPPRPPEVGRRRFDFSLDKGQYATVLLREFLKSGSIVPADGASPPSSS